MVEIGDRNKIGFVIGDRVGRDLRIVDIYIAGELVTSSDNTAYVPQFAHSVEYEATEIEQRNTDDGYTLLRWGPTTDDVSVHGVVENGLIAIRCKLRNGRVCETQVPTNYVVSVYRQAARALREPHA